MGVSIVILVVIFILGLLVGTNLGTILMCILRIGQHADFQERFEVLKTCHDEHYQDMLALMEETGILWEIVAKFVPPEGIEPLRQAIQERKPPC